MVGSASDTVTYTYDAANRPKTVVDSVGTITITIATDADGRTSSITFPSGTGVAGAYTYKNSGKPATIKYSKSGSSDILDDSYSYTISGVETDQLQTETDTGTASNITGTFTYGYNTTAELTSANNSAGDDYTYSYDKAGNITKATANASSSSAYDGYDRAGELCWTGTGTSAPSSQLGTTCPSTPSGYTADSSDNAGNNLGTSSAPNVYNGNSQATTVGGSTQTYLDLGNNLRTGASGTAGNDTTLNGPLGITARINSSGGLTFYTRDSSGQILDEHGSSGTRYYLSDYQGSVSALINTTGTLYASYAYDPYGKTTVNAESGVKTATENPWRYIGAYQDIEGDNNYHLGARYYDTTGHFTQPDALQGNISKPSSLNGYGYAAGDPINGVDPTGNSTVTFLEGLDGVVFGQAVVLTCDATAALLTPETLGVSALAAGLCTALAGSAALIFNSYAFD